MAFRMDAAPPGRLTVGGGREPSATAGFTSMYWCWVDRGLSAAGSMLGRSNGGTQWYHGYTSLYQHTFANGASSVVGRVIPPNQWVHLACVRTGSWHGIYFNGALDGTFSNAADPTNGILDMFRDSSNGFQYGGAIYCVKIWTRALSQAEIQTEMMLPYPGNMGAIYGWYSFGSIFGGVSANFTPDLSGKGNDFLLGTGAVNIAQLPDPWENPRVRFLFKPSAPAIPAPTKRPIVYGSGALLPFLAENWLRQRKNLIREGK